MIKGLVSIIIPLYNKENYVVQTLISVVNQTYTNWECLIIDDGSTDSSRSIVEEFCSRHEGRFRIISQNNQGQSSARNTGMRNSKGEFIAFLDADDLWIDAKLEKQVSLLRSRPECIAVFSGYAQWKPGHSLRIIQNRNVDKLERKWIFLSGSGGGLESVALIRSSLIKDFFFKPELSTSAGLRFFLELKSSGKIIFTHDIHMIYRIYMGQWHGDLKTFQKDYLHLASTLPSLISSKMIRSLNHYTTLYRLRQFEKKTSLSFLILFCKILTSPCVVFVSMKITNLMLEILKGFIYKTSITKFLRNLNIASLN